MNKSYIVLTTAVMIFAGCNGGKINLLGKGETQRIVAQGLSKYDKRDVSASKSIALFEAQKDAVSKISALFMGSSFLENDKILGETVLKNPQLYITKYKISEALKYGEHYRIKIVGNIIANGIIAELQSRTSAPKSEVKVMFMFNETYSDKALPEYYARKGFMEALKFGNFKFVDLPITGEKDFSLNKATALSMAENKGADILMIAVANADKMNASITGFASVSAVISLECLEVSSGKSIYEGFLKANAVDVSGEKAAASALTSAGKMAAEEASIKMVKSLPHKSPLKLTLTGADEFDKLEKFSNILISFENVSDLRLQSWSDDIAVFNVYGKNLGGEEFASSILRNKFSLLNLENVSNNEIVFSFMR
ncbi:MAG: hypothetical protein L6420_01845 [Elusimicrobia bacterium]|nr:hypothetical protein [Elusimicrobiota bacterium]